MCIRPEALKHVRAEFTGITEDIPRPDTRTFQDVILAARGFRVFAYFEAIGDEDIVMKIFSQAGDGHVASVGVEVRKCFRVPLISLNGPAEVSQPAMIVFIFVRAAEFISGGGLELFE